MIGNIQQTSLDAYFSLSDSRSEKRKTVYRAIQELGECSDQDISTRLGWPINCVTGRRGELVESGMVEQAGTKKNGFGRSMNTWRALV